MPTKPVKVGVIDDPIWAEPLPPPTPSLRLPSVRRISILIVAALIVATCVAWLLWPSPPSGGDPGGHILGQLRSISHAIPAGTKIVYAHYDEPGWDSCDGMAGTFGWDDPTVQIYFDWPGTPSQLIDEVKASLDHDGWTHYEPEVNNGLPGGGWSKTLRNGTTAQVQLGAEVYGGWTLFAQAPPVGQRVSGC